VVPRRMLPGAHHSSQAVQLAERAVQFAAKPNAGLVEITRRLFPGAYHSYERHTWEREGPGVGAPEFGHDACNDLRVGVTPKECRSLGAQRLRIKWCLGMTPRKSEVWKCLA
jgi:hypothetical protein